MQRGQGLWGVVGGGKGLDFSVAAPVDLVSAGFVCSRVQAGMEDRGCW